LQQRHGNLFTQYSHDLWEILNDPYEIAVMLRILMRCAFHGDGVCFETREHMSRACGISEKTWTQVIKSLESKGLINVTRRHKLPHEITLRGKNDLQKRYNIFCESNLPPKIDEDQMEEKKIKKKKVVRKRPTKEKKHKQPSVDRPLSEVDKIHRRWLKKQTESEKQ